VTGFITDAVLNQTVHDVLAKSTTETLATFWNSIITQANLQAYGDISGALAERGYLPQIVALWDRGVEFQTSLGIFWALTAAATKDPEQYAGRTMLEKYDRRPELRGNLQKDVPAVAVLVGGVYQYPGQTTVTVNPDTGVGQAAVTGRGQGYPHVGQPPELPLLGNCDNWPLGPWGE
jgi:hypothetical protein